MNIPEDVKNRKKELMRESQIELKERIKENLLMRNDFLSENTYKFCNLIISLDIGVIGATSFLILNKDKLQWITQILSISLILPIISIRLALRARNKIIETNSEICNRRANFAFKLINELYPSEFNKIHRTDQDLDNLVNEINRIEKDGENEIYNWCVSREPEISRIMQRSLDLLIWTLYTIIIIILIESGTINLIGEFFYTLLRYFYA